MGIVFEYVSSSGNAVNSTNISLGTVAMATQYNTNALAPLDERHMLNMEYVCATKPSNNLMHGVECDPKQMVLPLLYTNPGTVVAPHNDLRFQNLGNINVATFGSQYNGVLQTIGQLWVTYDIELIGPYLDSTAAYSTHIQFDPTSVTVLKPFGTSSGNVVGANSNLQLEIDQPGLLLSFPPGSSNIYTVTYSVYCDASSTWTAPTLTGVNGATPYNLFVNDTLSSTPLFGAGTTVTISACFDVQDLGDGTLPSITFSSDMVLPGAIIGADLFVNAVNYTR
jgi:hypothetical protein